MKLNVAVQMDPIARINIRGDSTFALLLEAQKRGHSLSYYTPDKLSQRGTELVAEWRPSPQSRWTAAAFDNRASDLISQRVDPADGLLVFRNGDTQHTRGVELEFEHVWLGGARLSCGHGQL